MPAPNERVCTHCGVPCRSAQMRCYTAVNGRNYYYCPSCTSTQFVNCMNCNEVKKLTPGGYLATNRDWDRILHLVNTMPAGNRSCEAYSKLSRWAEAPNRVLEHAPGLFYRRGFCAACQDHGQGYCYGCGHRIGLLLGVALEYFFPEGVKCYECIVNKGVCDRCGTKDVRTEPWSCFHGRVTKRTCMRCRTTPRESTYKVIKSKRTIGYELEFLTKYASPSPLDLLHYGTLKQDGSLYAQEHDNPPYLGDTMGIEMVSDVCRGDYIMEHIAYVLPYVKKHNGWMNKKCGLHVHLGMSDTTHEQRDNLVRWWRYFEPLLFAMVPENRRSNSFCRPGAGTHRYSALNVSAYERHKTFEVRLHHGTLDVKELQGWCALLLDFFDTFIDVPYNNKEIQSKLQLATNCKKQLRLLLQMCKMPFWLKKHLSARIVKQNSMEWMKENGFKVPKKKAPSPESLRVSDEIIQQAQQATERIRASQTYSRLWRIDTSTSGMNTNRIQ